ncbi:hypothetical protein EV175_005954, partial [Coemansia sp. RSA 1933]
MKGKPAEVICEALNEKVWAPAHQVKEAIRCQNYNAAELSNEAWAIIRDLEPVLNAYDDDYDFFMDDWYWDAKGHPLKHAKAFYMLAHFFEQCGMRSFQCFPLRTSWIPKHTHIDSRILRSHFFSAAERRGKCDMELWGEVLNLKHRAIKPRNGHAFWGSINTDAVAVSIYKETEQSKKKKSVRRKQASKDKSDNKAELAAMELAVTKLAAKGSSGKKTANKDGEIYIHELGQQQVKELEGRCVLADPGRHDYLRCMHEYSTPKFPSTYRYTRNQANKEKRIGRFKKICKNAKDTMHVHGVREAEAILAKVPHRSVNSEKLIYYIQIRAMVEETLWDFYESQMTTHTSSHHQVHKKRPNYQACNHPLHRKLRLSAFINQKQADSRLIWNLKKQFGDDMVMVIGN